MRFRPAERLALIGASLRTFAIVSTANLSSEATIQVLTRAEPRIRDVLANEPLPSYSRFTRTGRFAN